MRRGCAVIARPLPILETVTVVYLTTILTDARSIDTMYTPGATETVSIAEASPHCLMTMPEGVVTVTDEPSAPSTTILPAVA